MTTSTDISPRFLSGLHANLIYWRQRTANLDDVHISLLNPEFPNLLQAIRLGTVHPETRPMTMQLMLHLFHWVEQGAYWHDWLPLIDRLLANWPSTHLRERCRLLKQQGQLLRSAQRLPAAIAALQASAQIAQQLGDDVNLIEAQLHLSICYRLQRQYDHALRLGQHALQTCQVLPDTDRQKAALLYNLGLIAQEQGVFDLAANQLCQAVHLGRAVYAPTQTARLLQQYAIILMRQNKLAEAEVCYQEAAELLAETVSGLEKIKLNLSLGTLYEQMQRFAEAAVLFTAAYEALKHIPGQLHQQARAAHNLGVVLVKQDQLAEAEHYLRRSAAVRRQLGDTLLLANTLGSLGEALAKQNQYEEARSLYDEALTILATFPHSNWAQTMQRDFQKEYTAFFRSHG